MRKQIISILLLVCWAFQLGAEINLKLNKTKIGVDEPFSVIFSSNKNLSEPDFSPLLKDFNITSTSQEFLTGYVNGRFTNETQYKLTLTAKQEGIITLPQISFGTELSPSKTIEVTKVAFAVNDNSLFFETEVSPKESIYPQTQLIYTIRLFRTEQVTQAKFSDVKVSDPDAIIMHLKDDEFEYINPAGFRYLVFERRYAVFPQHSGDLYFPPIIFEGHIVKGRSSVFHVQTEYKRASSEPQKVTVLDIPKPFQKKDWFAAQDLKLKEEWSADPAKITVGEPITWTLTLKAEGCLGNQIPEIDLNLPSFVKHYHDKPEITDIPSKKGFTGVRKIKTALIATKPGELILPEITLKWWDVKTNQMRITSLPSRTIQVEEGLVAMADSMNSEKGMTGSFDEKTNGASSLDGLKNETRSSELILPTWAWGLIGLNLIWIIIFLKRIFGRTFSISSRKHNDVKAETETFSNRNVKSLLKQACYNNDAKQAEIYLLKWAKIQFPKNNAKNLAQIKGCFDLPMQEAIKDINNALYGHSKTWGGKLLWEAVSTFKAKRSVKVVEGDESTDIYGKEMM